MFEWNRLRGGWMNHLSSLALALTLTLVMRTVTAEPYVVPMGSGLGPYAVTAVGLMPGLGNHVPGVPPKRGDVIVFRLSSEAPTTYVKRIIGLPGERIEMRRGQLYIDGEMVPRRLVGSMTTQAGGRLVSLLHYVETLPNGREHDILKTSDDQPLDNTAEFVVPLRSYFVMGDNRDDSVDSRVPVSAGGLGFVPVESLVGRVDLVRFPRDPEASSWTAIPAASVGGDRRTRSDSGALNAGMAGDGT